MSNLIILAAIVGMVVAWIVSVALIGLILRAALVLPFSEERRLDRRLRVAERERRLLAKRRKVEAAEAEYRAELESVLDETT